MARKKKKKEKSMVAEHVLEVRHAASGSFLDVRGYVADYIRSQGILRHWKIGPNGVDFRDTPDGIKLDGAFASFKSAGYVVYNPETRNYFIDRASAFWRTLLENQHYKLPDATRFGVRTKIFLPSDLAFAEINRIVFDTFYTPQVRDLIGGRETDVQFIIELVESQFEVRLSGGPIHENEVGKYMSFKSQYFEGRGFYLDVDYYKTRGVTHDAVPVLLKAAVNLGWTKLENIVGALGL